MATLSQPIADVQSAYMAQFDRIQAMIYQRCRSEERRQNALAWSWELFRRYFHGDNAEQAATAAAMYGAKRRQVFGKPGRNGYVDALDHAEHWQPDVALDEYRDDCRAITWRIADMPIKLQMVALPLANGLTRQQTAALVGCSVRTVHNRCAAIERWILNHSPWPEACRLMGRKLFAAAA